MKKQHISLIKVLNMNHHFYFNSHLQMALFWTQHSMMIYDWWLIRVFWTQRNQIQYEVWSMCVWLVTDSIINKKKTIENTLKNYLKEKRNYNWCQVEALWDKNSPRARCLTLWKKKKKENNCLKDKSELCKNICLPLWANSTVRFVTLHVLSQSSIAFVFVTVGFIRVIVFCRCRPTHIWCKPW